MTLHNSQYCHWPLILVQFCQSSTFAISFLFSSSRWIFKLLPVSVGLDLTFRWTFWMCFPYQNWIRISYYKHRMRNISCFHELISNVLSNHSFEQNICHKDHTWNFWNFDALSRYDYLNLSCDQRTSHKSYNWMLWSFHFDTNENQCKLAVNLFEFEKFSSSHSSKSISKISNQIRHP